MLGPVFTEGRVDDEGAALIILHCSAPDRLVAGQTGVDDHDNPAVVVNTAPHIGEVALDPASLDGNRGGTYENAPASRFLSISISIGAAPRDCQPVDNSPVRGNNYVVGGLTPVKNCDVDGGVPQNGGVLTSGESSVYPDAGSHYEYRRPVGGTGTVNTLSDPDLVSGHGRVHGLLGGCKSAFP